MDSITSIRNFLNNVPTSCGVGELTLRRCVSEAWFSDTLAWLLDPSASHGTGVGFLRAFVKELARRRSDRFARRETHLKFGKGGRGRGSTSFNFGNATVLREFFLAKSVGSDGLQGSRYCDLVVMDFDSQDGFFMGIENKLFTTNREGQLGEYLETVEDRYERAEVREYVYLTLNGHEPAVYRTSNERVLERWVPMSWTGDILKILNSLEAELTQEALSVRDLLRWLSQLMPTGEDAALSTPDVEAFRGLVLRAAAECLLEELERLGEGKTGHWEILTDTNNTFRLVHSSFPKQYLYVEMLPNFSVTMQTRYNRRGQYEKIFVPFGAQPEQVFNLLDMSARDIYHRHFTNLDRYLGNKRRLTATITEKKQEYHELFKFLHARRFELQVLLTVAHRIWDAARQEHESVPADIDTDAPEQSEASAQVEGHAVE